MPAPTRGGRIYGQAFAASRKGEKARTRDETAEAVERFKTEGGTVQQCDAKPARYLHSPQRRKK